MKVGVIMGGVSSEREVSLMTGREMLAHLDRRKYEVRPIEINSREELIEKAAGIDVALLALHGRYGEDGTIQGTLDTMGIPYTGSGVLSSGLCMNKDISKKLIRAEGVRTPDWFVLKSADDLDEEEAGRFGYPVVVKPNCGGSSIGIRLACSKEQLASAVREAGRWDDEIVIERHVEGEEFTCAILNGRLLPIVKIRPHADFFDYESKYADGKAEETVVELPDDLTERIRTAALTCYKALKCSVYARVDILVQDGVPYVLEVNSLPGLTKNSLLPKSAQAAGISFGRLLDLIIAYSLEARKNERRAAYGNGAVERRKNRIFLAGNGDSL